MAELVDSINTKALVGKGCSGVQSGADNWRNGKLAPGELSRICPSIFISSKRCQ